MSYIIPKTRGSKLTVIGAITNQKNKIYYHIGETTNIQNFFKFLIMLEDNKLIYNKLMVMDNHKAHHNKEILQYIKQ